jgi:hypothetical protein
MNTQHTPGEWELFFTGMASSPDWMIKSKENKTIAILPDTEDWYKNRSELKANARLIAAAPELLRTLQQLYNSFQHTEGNDKGNQAKTDVILYNEDVKAALNATMKLLSKIK